MSLEAAQRRLVEAHVAWAKGVASAMAGSYRMREGQAELGAVAVEAMAHAATLYDPSRQVPFPSFAYKRVVGAVRRAIQGERRLVAVALEALDAMDGAEAALDSSAGLMVDELCDDWMDLSFMTQALRAPEMALIAQEERAALRAAMAQLAPLERKLVEARHFDQTSWPETAQRLGISERTARDWDVKIRRKLKLLVAEILDGGYAQRLPRPSA